MRGRLLPLLAMLLSALAYSARAQDSQASPRDPTWAQKVADVPEIPKLFAVEANFYRSPQPTEAGFKAMVMRKGLRSVVNLRASHSDDSLTQGLGLHLFDFKMHAWHIEREDVVGALRALRNETRMGPALLHCTLGADRTGLVAALYRMIYKGWSKQAALEEMEHGGFGFHDIWINIPRFIDELDIDQLNRDVGVP
jgi:protein tyrosine/serine phosphatase